MCVLRPKKANTQPLKFLFCGAPLPYPSFSLIFKFSALKNYMFFKKKIIILVVYLYVMCQNLIYCSIIVDLHYSFQQKKKTKNNLR